MTPTEQALATAIAETRAFWLEQEARECREDFEFELRRYAPCEGFGHVPRPPEILEREDDTA